MSRELLEAAARAAGITYLEGEYETALETDTGEFWSPLHSDADAFRLMVDCGIDVEWGKNACHAINYSRPFVEPYGTDKHAATRLAVVRAAAAMETDRAEEVGGVH